MESLLPSEIARLVLGYLEEQKCDEAARSFLEMCPHLQECRTVISNGRRFSTRVNGLTLSDILEKFCSANAIIHERLSKVSDCEQLKHCGDLLEQLRFLVDGSRSQRFVVNINVPTPSQTSGASPIISSSMRKRHHSGSDRDRLKRVSKSHSHTSRKSSEPVSSQLDCNAVETTPLEHLPGNSGLGTAEGVAEKSTEKFQEHRPAHCSSTVTEATGSQSLPENHRESRGSIQSTSLPDFQELRNLDAYTANSRHSVEKQEITHDKCSAATDTEELMRFTNTEVQTTPYDVAESETELTDEPVENLSLLTKELLNRTELQERIAENINKAILPADVSLRDVSLSESLGGEMNTSIMTELNNAIKSVVTATESDPVFAKFLDDIIGPSGENDTSPDEDADHQPICTDGFADNNSDLVPKEPSIEALTPYVEKPIPEIETTDVPLKNRLRSSSSQQIVRPEDDRFSAQKPDKKEDIALEDLNAAAIFSIINVNNKLAEEPPSLDLARDLLRVNVEADKNIVISNQEEAVGDIPTIKSDIPEAMLEDTKANVAPEVPCSSLDSKSSRKLNAKKSRAPRQKPKAPEVAPESLISEEEIMAMPTLIVCTKEEMSTLMGAPPTVPAKGLSIGGYCASQFLPIAPKTDDIILAPPKPEPIYLRAVNVPMKLPKSIAPKPDADSEPQPVPPSKSRQARRLVGRATERKPKITKQAESATNAQNSLNSGLEPNPTPELPVVEKVTLYGENSSGAVLDETEIPAVQVDEPMISISGTGLSPFLKFNNLTPNPLPEDVEINEKTTNSEEPLAPAINVEPVATEQQAASTSKEDCYDVLTKRTPRSLLKSRSKNHRLSLSTPRRRSSHIRALDFNTPTKVMNSSRRMSTNECHQFSPKTLSFARTVCRTSLFKSPPFIGTPTPSKKIKSPVKDCRPCKIPIATRSPAPKLMGGWEKYTGVGMILGSTSPSSTSCSPVKLSTPSQIANKSWDADLRRSLQLAEESQPKVTKKPAAKKPQNKRRTRKKPITSKSISQIEDCSSDRECLPPVKEPDAHPHDISTAPQGSPVEESHTTDLAEEPVDASEKIEVVTEFDSAPKKSPKEVIILTKTAAASNSADNVDSACKSSETITNTTETVKTVTSSDVTVKSDKSVKKKYAKLKTITTSVTNIERGENRIELVGTATETVEKSSEFSRTHTAATSRRISHMPDMLDLETPRKFDIAFGIPPTPRLLSPSSSMTTPFGLQVGEDSGKMRSFITTPEFPPTPSIAVTPKQTSENTVDASKKEQFSSTYYQPSSELKDPRLPKNDQSRHEMSLPLLGMTALTTETCVTNISSEVAQGFQACTTSNKLEITQFEVIKENLPREEAFRELKISTSAKEPGETAEVEKSNEIPAAPSVADQDELQETEDADNSGSTADDDSSDSDTSDSSSDSSSSSSSSSSSNSSATNTSAKITLTKQYANRTPNKIYTDTSNESGKKAAANAPSLATTAKDADSKNLQTEDHSGTANDVDTILQDLSSRVENEASPQKVFSIAKTEEDLKESVKETPAKDDSLLSEAVISETPSSSKTGIETLTNLNTKISALITSEDQEFSRSSAACDDKASVEDAPKKSLPKVISVQRILPDVSIALKPVPVCETLLTAMQSRNHGALQPSAMSDAKLSRQLEEKRLRLMAKFKEKENPPAYRPRIKRTVALPKGRKQTREKDESFAEEAKRDTAEETELRKRKSSRIREIEENHDNAKKDANEEEEEEKVEIVAKAETKRKSQMLKELFDESLPEEPAPSKEATKEETEVSLKITEKDNEEPSDARTDKEKKDNAAECKNNELKSKDKPYLSERLKRKSEPEAKVCKETAKPIGSNFEELPEGRNDDSLTLGATEEVAAQSSVNSKKETEKEECAAQRSATSPIKSKIVTKSKVDLVKRDLFSDEESSDQRTTRSRTRQTSDAQKSDSAESHISVVSDPRNNRSATPKEDLPGVLECLQLVPTIKSDAADEEVNVLEISQCHAEYHYVYDDSVPTKKRKRKFSSSELEFVVQVEVSDDNYKMCSKIMTATPYEEMFNLSPPRKKRGPSKEATAKVTKYKKKEVNTPKNAKSIFKDIREKPLATSSPVVKTVASKVASKTLKLPATKSDSHQPDAKKKTAVKTEKTQSEHVAEKPNSKSRKRKASVSKDSEQVDKKSRTTDPQLLSKLSKVDLDKFLTTVHGPA